MHFLHKTFPGTSYKISHCKMFHSSNGPISWLSKKNRSCSLDNWESTIFIKTLAFLNFGFTVNKLKKKKWLTHPTQLCGMPDMSLVSLTGLWCPWPRWNNQTDLCETTQCSSPLCSIAGDTQKNTDQHTQTHIQTDISIPWLGLA